MPYCPSCGCQIKRKAKFCPDCGTDQRVPVYDDNMDDILKRKNVALENSWHNRVKELEELIKKRMVI